MASSLASEHINIAEDIMETAKDLESKGIKPRDAIHLACAINGKADYFLTCDDRLIKKAAHFSKSKIVIISPIDFIRMEVK